MTMTWQNGRELATLTKDGKTIGYSYNADGIRTENNNGVVTKYFYDSNNNLTFLICGDTQLVFYYDADGQADSFIVYSGDTATRYYYVKNLQGDITKIMTADGAVVANYYYSAYGEILSITDADGEPINNTSTVAFHNPLRYRGYVYDSDTGLYYLQSRYYDPTTKRFINEDIYVDTTTGVLGTNMFAYRGNNPIVRIDVAGAVWITFSPLVFANIGTFARNYNHNKNVSITGYIYDQNSGKAAQIWFGVRKDSSMGCGWVATYNALRMLGARIHPSQIVLEYESNCSVLIGKLGLPYNAIVNFFRIRKYRVTVSKNVKDFDKTAKKNKANIILYAHSSGPHFVALYWNGSNYAGYNTFSGKTSATNWGNSIKGFLNKYKYTPKVLISISKN